MKKIIVALFCVSLSLGIYANGTDKEAPIFNPESKTVLTGTVVDQNSGETLTGVLIKIKGSDKSFYTDFEGNFVIKGLIPGDYELELTLVSYKSNHLQRVDLDKDGKNSLKVEMKQ